MQRSALQIQCAAARGFTLLEVLLVLVILSISAALVVPVIGGGIGTTEAKVAARKLGTALNYARGLSIREKINYFVVVNDKKVLVVSGEGKVRKEFTFSDSINITPDARITFFPRGGSSGGEFAIEGGGAGFRVKVTLAGLVRVAE